MKIVIDTIPHRDQPYPTVGNWWFDGFGDLHINISKMGNDDSEFLVAIHEIIEAYLCKKSKIRQEDVDKWDLEHLECKEPGNLPDCPYYYPHHAAEFAERLVAIELGVDWITHCARVEAL